MIKASISLVCVLVLGATACSRESRDSRSPSEAPTLTPASGPALAQTRQPATRCSQNFQVFDANDDGLVSRDELAAHPHAHGDASVIFDARDRDADGKLTENELCAGFRSVPREPSSGRGPEEGASGPGTMRAPGAAHPDLAAKRPRCEQHFEAFDADQDGRLTKEEFAARPHVHGDADSVFAERDMNEDNFVTREEFCSAWRR